VGAKSALPIRHPSSCNEATYLFRQSFGPSFEHAVCSTRRLAAANSLHSYLHLALPLRQKFDL
jgi:hypothetical protein